jgi:hypothetical protein
VASGATEETPLARGATKGGTLMTDDERQAFLAGQQSPAARGVLDRVALWWMRRRARAFVTGPGVVDLSERTYGHDDSQFAPLLAAFAQIAGGMRDSYVAIGVRAATRQRDDMIQMPVLWINGQLADMTDAIIAGEDNRAIDTFSGRSHSPGAAVLNIVAACVGMPLLRYFAVLAYLVRMLTSPALDRCYTLLIVLLDTSLCSRYFMRPIYRIFGVLLASISIITILVGIPLIPVVLSAPLVMLYSIYTLVRARTIFAIRELSISSAAIVVELVERFQHTALLTLFYSFHTLNYNTFHRNVQRVGAI